MNKPPSKTKKVLTVILAVVLMGIVAGIKIYRINDHLVRKYTNENGIYSCSKLIKVEDYQAYGNSYKLETFQRPVHQGEADKYCKQEASF